MVSGSSRAPQSATPAIGKSVRARRGVTLAGILLGVGLGGFFDGIVLHQILQWHHMLSSTAGAPTTTVLGLERNTFWDGLFHAAAWIVTLAGLALLWRSVRRGEAPPSGRVLAGLLAIGWALFNLVEGVIDHELLGIHHVRPGAHHLAWDLGDLALSALLLAFGWWLARETLSQAVD